MLNAQSSGLADQPSDNHKLPLTKRIYTNGTLKYTFWGLLILFFWILWGDFAFTIFENIQRFIILLLDEQHASSTLIANLGSTACIANLFFGPGISQWSDNCRTPWGRRKPFLAIATPLTALSMLMMGITPQVGSHLFSAFRSQIAPYLSESALILSLFCMFVALFHYFNMVLCNAFNWLFRDVVPKEVVARMQAAMRFVSLASSMAFNHYVFPHIMTHRVTICVTIGIFYTVAFFMMCWGVKEGEYPPQKPKVKATLWQFVESYIGYFRECTSVPIYRNVLLIYVITACGACAGAFSMLLWKNTLHIDMQGIGDLNNWGLGSSLVVSLFAGWLCDKYNPFRVMMCAQAFGFIIGVVSFFYVHDYHSLLVATLAGWGINAGATISMGAAIIFVFPRDKFGQFSTATNVIPMGICIVANALTGLLFDRILHNNYQYIFMFSAMGSGLAIIPTVFVYRAWRSHGGHDYQAPHVPDLTPLKDVLGKHVNKGSV